MEAEDNYSNKINSYMISTDVISSFVIPHEDVRPCNSKKITSKENSQNSLVLSSKQKDITSNEDQKSYNVSTNVGESFVIPTKDLIIKEKLNPRTINKVQLSTNINSTNDIDLQQEKSIHNFESYTISTNVLLSYVIPAKDLITKKESSVLKTCSNDVVKYPRNRKIKRKIERKRRHKSSDSNTSNEEEEEILSPLKKSKDIDLLLESVTQFEKQIESQDFSTLSQKEQKQKIKQQESHIESLLRVLNSLQSSMKNVTRSNRKKEMQISKLKNLLSELGMEIVEEDTLVLDT